MEEFSDENDFALDFAQGNNCIVPAAQHFALQNAGRPQGSSLPVAAGEGIGEKVGKIQKFLLTFLKKCV